MQEKKAIELLKEAWVLLDIVEPNNPVTDKLWKFLTDIGEETEMEKLVAWLKHQRQLAKEMSADKLWLLGRTDMIAYTLTHIGGKDE